MIDRQEIEDKSRHFNISPTDVEKDYVYGWILNALFSCSPLGSLLILKGGNGLRKAYLPNTRFSKDLDFSCLQHLDQGFLTRELNKICDFVESQVGIYFSTNQTIVRSKDLPAGIDAVEARLYFKGFYGEENITLKAQLDITQFDKIYLPIQNREIIHPYSDSADCRAGIRCQKIEEILASKLTTLLHRRKAIDLFDLLYSIIFTNDFSVDRLQVITTFLKKSTFEAHPTVIRDELLAVPLDDFKPLWKTIVAPLASLFSFDYVLNNFRSVIESLFGLVAAAIPALVPRFQRRSTSSSRGPIAPSHFLWDARSVIISSVQSHTLIELTYDGLRRLVEPYRIEYYVRKSDGTGSEYFWGYDTSGGKSGRIGIKQFFCNKIRFARPTNISFTPRF